MHVGNRRGTTGFTLIELLVVIAVIALLMSILMPALNAAREQSRKTMCAQNEKNTALGLIMYANDYKGRLPFNSRDRWLFDVTYWTTDIVLATGAFDRHIFYCPSWRQRDNIIFWRYGENLPGGTPEEYERPEPTATEIRKDFHRILGYFWLIDFQDPSTGKGRPNQPMSSGETKVWAKSVVEAVATVNGKRIKKPPASVELITDTTASDGPDRQNADFTKATGGVMSRWGIYDRSNHVKSKQATGTNVAFLDGHVAWRPFDEMEHRWFYKSYGNPCLWW
ncbi:MAG: type II secretion system protein [Phycisphaerae bacterium]|nr:type II secretion system protein [Phycisphaerae bacterium]